ncbi:MAG TPA: hypothetical protein VEC99_10210, partial [Clostridia bacterium]|nr:hypothetical protein [Clostridia bacterium]
MRKKTMAPQLFWVLISCVSLLCSFSEVSAQEIVNDASLVARPTSGGGDSFNPIVTPDGRYVLFASTAANLVVSSNNTPLISHGPPNTLNVFLRDRSAGKTSLVSVNLEGNAGANADTIPVGISTNGRYVLFESAASNLVFGDTNTCTDVFLRDVIKGETILVSASYKGGVAFGWSRETVMTPDGRWVAFASSAVDIVSGDTNEIVDVFVRDLQTKVTKAASTGAVRKLSYPQGSSSPVITPDGRYVAFLSGATNLVPRVTTSGEVYVRDLVSGATRVVSTNAHTSPSDSIISYNQAISDDGQYVAFETSSGTIFRYHLPSRSFERVATNATVLNPASTSYGHFRSLDMSPDGRFITWLANSGTGSKVLLWDGQTKVTTLVNVDINHLEPTNSLSEWPCVSADGRWVAFLSTATNLTTNVVVEGFHLYVRDMQAEDTRLVDRGTNGIGSPREFLNAPCLAPDGKFIVYDCSDSGQVDGDNNHAYDVFFTDLESGTTELISARDAALPSTTLPAARYGAVFSLNRDGRFVAFTSFADNLLRGAT